MLTESEWARSRNPVRMLRAVGVLSARQLLLVGCGCYRLAWEDIPLVELRPVIEEVERAADGESTPEANAQQYAVADFARNMSTGTLPGIPPVYKSVNGWAAAWAAYSLNVTAGMGNIGGGHLLAEIVSAISDLVAVNRQPSVNRIRQAAVVRCVVGSPFRSPAWDPRWRTETAVALAAGVYDERAFDRLPILADALEEAGCDHPDVIAHCRAPGPHARGCWVVDWLLGKS